jgi:diaminopimelate epimerase
MRIEFTKMHGLGNDFIVFDTPSDGTLPTTAQWQALANRHTGIGFDQALVLAPPRRADSAVFYRIFNADGQEVQQCGNGARCIAALLQRRGFSRDGWLIMESPGGTVRARALHPDWITVDMGVPNFDPAILPFDAPGMAEAYDLHLGGQTVSIAAVSMGNPHAVLIVEDVDQAAVEVIGPLIESHKRFPQRVNVGFMQIIDPSAIKLRVYERGAGETLACGTGACAAVAVGRRRGQLNSEVKVSVRGGELSVNWQGDAAPLWMTGPAQIAFAGHVEL